MFKKQYNKRNNDVDIKIIMHIIDMEITFDNNDLWPLLFIYDFIFSKPQELPYSGLAEPLILLKYRKQKF